MEEAEMIPALNAVLGLPETIEELNQMCEVVIPDAIEALDGDPIALAHLMHQVKVIHRKMKGTIEDIEAALVDAMPTKQMVIDGIGEIEWHGASSRKEWQHDALVPKITAVIAEDVTVWHDFDTGEELAEPTTRGEIVARVVGRLRDIATLTWKVGTKQRDGSFKGGLRSVDLDPDEFCTTEWGRKRVTFPTIEELV